MNKESSVSSSSMWMSFIYFSCIVALSGTSITMLNRSAKHSHSCFVPDIRGKVFSPLSLNLM